MSAKATALSRRCSFSGAEGLRSSGGRAERDLAPHKLAHDSLTTGQASIAPVLATRRSVLAEETSIALPYMEKFLALTMAGE